MLEIVSLRTFNEMKEKLKSEDVTLKVMSNSMEPLIKVDDEVTVRQLDKALKKFDIIVYWNGKILVGHYVWHINKHFSRENSLIITTRCLSSKWEDLPIQEEQILGVIVSHKISFWWRMRLTFRHSFSEPLRIFF